MSGDSFFFWEIIEFASGLRCQCMHNCLRQSLVWKAVVHGWNPLLMVRSFCSALGMCACAVVRSMIVSRSLATMDISPWLKKRKVTNDLEQFKSTRVVKPEDIVQGSKLLGAFGLEAIVLCSSAGCLLVMVVWKAMLVTNMIL